jgi:hypothetical protein
MGSNTITPPPVLNRNSSDDEILGLLTQAPRRTARREANGERRDPSAQDSAARTNEQLAMDFGHEEVQRGARRASAGDAGASGVSATGQLESEHLRAALDANPELRDAWQEASAYRETFATPEAARAATALVGDRNRMDALFFCGVRKTTRNRRARLRNWILRRLHRWRGGPGIRNGHRDVSHGLQFRPGVRGE